MDVFSMTWPMTSLHPPVFFNSSVESSSLFGNAANNVTKRSATAATPITTRNPIYNMLTKSVHHLCHACMFNFRSSASTNFWNLKALSAFTRLCYFFLSLICRQFFAFRKRWSHNSVLSHFTGDMVATRSQAKSLPLALDKPVLVKHQFRLRWAPNKNCAEFCVCYITLLNHTESLLRFNNAQSVR